MPLLAISKIKQALQKRGSCEMGTSELTNNSPTGVVSRKTLSFLRKCIKDTEKTRVREYRKDNQTMETFFGDHDDKMNRTNSYSSAT